LRTFVQCALYAWGWIVMATLPACPQSKTGDAGMYRVAGTVVNASTGEPLGRVSVALLEESNSEMVENTIADREGHFVLEKLPAGKYQLTASKRGYHTAFYDEHGDYNCAIVTGPGQDTEHLVFRLPPNAILHGVVSGDGGDPVEDARVMLFKVPSGIGRDLARARGPDHSVEQVASTMSDDRGEYEFGDLEAGDYLLAVTADPWYAVHNPPRTGPDGAGATNDHALDVAYPVTYFDSTTDELSATPVSLASGDRQQADINLHAVPALHLTVAAPQKANGNIARPELRQSIFGTQVMAVSQGFEDALKTGTTDFIGIAPGHYELLQGDPPRLVDMEATASAEVNATEGAPTVTVSGSLRSIDGSMPGDDVTVALYPMDATQRLGVMQVQAARGGFRFENVPPGRWELAAWNRATPISVVSLSSGKITHAGPEFVVSDRPVSITVNVSSGSTRVTGFAQKNGAAAAGMLVVLVPKNAAAYDSLVRRDESDSDGSFALRNVAPGEYTLIALENAWDLDRAGPETLARYLPQGIGVTVRSTAGTLTRLSQTVPVQAR